MLGFEELVQSWKQSICTDELMVAINNLPHDYAVDEFLGSWMIWAFRGVGDRERGRFIQQPPRY